MKNLILGFFLLSQVCFARTANDVYRMPSSGNIPGWGTITGSSVASSANFPGNTVQENGKNVVVSSSNATTSLAIVRGGGSSISSNCGNTTYGEGYSCNRTGTGVFAITFTNAFSDTPVCTCSTSSNLAYCLINTLPNTTGVTFEMKIPGGGDADAGHFWICIGQR